MIMTVLMIRLAHCQANDEMEVGGGVEDGVKDGVQGTGGEAVCVCTGAFCLYFLCRSVSVCVCVSGMGGLKRLNPSVAAVTREDPSVERSHCREASSAVSHLHGSLSCSGN